MRTIATSTTSRLAPALGMLAALLLLAVPAGAGFAPYPYTDTFETGINTNYWSVQGTWGPSWETAQGGVTALTDSPWSVYGASQDSAAVLGVDLRFAAVRPVLSFWQRYGFEPNRDFGFVEVSQDQGASWTRLAAATGYSGPAWTLAEVDLTSYAGAQVLIRFRILSDGAFQYDGWYVDSLEVKERTPVSVFPVWASFEAGTASSWMTAPPWVLTQGGPKNPGGQSWRCVNGNGYRPGGDVSAPLTFANRINLGGATNPKLSFWWRAGAQPNNVLYAQTSTDGGKTWANIWSWSSYWNASADWTRTQVDLNGYIGNTNLSLRFLAAQDGGNSFVLDFQVDEVRVDDAPPELALSVGPGTDPRHAALLSWNASTATDFGFYAIYRATSAGVDLTDTLVTLISNKNTTSFQDTNLAIVGQPYYFRALVWDTDGLHNWGTNEVSYITAYGQMVAAFPWLETFDGGDARWSLDRPWSLTTQMSRSGANCLGSNPGTTYANGADVSAYVKADFATANRPMLSFWQRYGFELNQDFGFVEVSANNGTSWTRLYAVTGQSGTNWSQVKIDLGAYAGAQALIRFRVRADGQNPYDGWFIDDVELKDLSLALSFPFQDGMEVAASTTNWLASSWQWVAGGYTNTSVYSWRAQYGNGYRPGGDVNSYLTVAGTFNLASAVNPKLWFWWRAGTQPNNTLCAQASTDGGKNWSNIWSWNSYWNGSATWARVQVDLNSYIGQTNLALRFLAWHDGGNSFVIDFQVDDVKVGDQPAPAPEIAASVAPGPDPRHQASLAWTASSASAFVGYGIYRATGANPTVANLLVAMITNRATTSFTDTNLDICGLSYYYRVIVWDTNGLHNAGMNDLVYKTKYGTMLGAFPAVLNLEAGDAAWALDRPWALSTEMPRGAGYSLASNPGTNYQNGVDAAAYLNLDLATANRPMLTFWHKFNFEPNQDFAFIEVSQNQGASWNRLYALTGQGPTNWTQVSVDLGAYTGTQLLLRFRIVTDGQNTYDGWHIDDVEIRDFGTVYTLPLDQNMDTVAGGTNWVRGWWNQVPGGRPGTGGMSWQIKLGNGYRPGGDANGLLTLAGGVNLAAAINPKLSFWWRAGTQPNNTLYAQASTDGGKNWATIWSWNSYWNGGADWSRTQVNLNAYAGHTNLALRFQAALDGGNSFVFDFQVDEVLVDDAPADVTLAVAPGTDPRHNALLSWSPSAAADFSFYAIYRATSAGVDPADWLVTLISNKNTTSFQDAGLDVVTQPYYYRVLVWDTQGLHNWGGNEVVYTTALGQLASFPVAESFGAGDAIWSLDRPWQISNVTAHTGTNCLASNPGGTYANNADASAYLNVDLAHSDRPVLTFWHRYGFEPNQDFGFVEASVNQGSTWSRIYGVTGQSGAAWSKVAIDLGSYTGSKLLLRFRVRADGQNPYDGWFIDDVEVKDQVAVALGYPFYDGMDTTWGSSNWLAGGWQQVPGSANGASGMSYRALIGNGYRPGGDLYAIMDSVGGINFSSAVNPKLWFWYRAGGQPNNTLYAQLSPDNGRSWATVWSWNSYWNASKAWTRVQVDLNSYLGYTNVLLRFTAALDGGNSYVLDFQVDDVLVSEGGGIPAILTASPLPLATLAYPYNLVLQATNAFLPYTWSVVSNALPPGMVLDSVAGILSGTPTAAGDYSFWLNVSASNVLSAKKQFQIKVLDYLAFLPAQSAPSFVTPGTNTVYCQIDNQTGKKVLSLVWAPTLPAGWSIVGVQGDGNPSVGMDGRILFQAQALTNKPVKFAYKVKVPTAETQAKLIYGAAVALLEGMVNERNFPAFPNPIFTVPRAFHVADCSTNWVIDSLEASRVLSYWRAQTYALDPASCDGYAPGPGDQNGPLHSADYQPPGWMIDGTEINRVLAFWRAGCYKPDPAGVDGYAAGCIERPARYGKKDLGPTVRQYLPLAYKPGSSLLVTNVLTYSGDLLSLLWRPQLPSGWTFSNVLADGAPEVVNGEIVWTAATLPPSPIQVLYFVQVPADAVGSQPIASDMEYQMAGVANSSSIHTTALLGPGSFKFTAIERLDNGAVRLSLSGSIDAPVRILGGSGLQPEGFSVLTTLPSLHGTATYTDSAATNQAQRVYRLISP